MSMDRECRACGEEYDCRRSHCPSCGLATSQILAAADAMHAAAIRLAHAGRMASVPTTEAFREMAAAGLLAFVSQNDAQKTADGRN